ncbi:putative ribosomal protein S17e [Helianthus anomalus]
MIEVDKETIEMLNSLGMGDLPGVVEASVEPQALSSVPAFGRGSGATRRY